jgi:phage shock protein E
MTLILTSILTLAPTFAPTRAPRLALARTVIATRSLLSAAGPTRAVLISLALCLLASPVFAGGADPAAGQAPSISPPELQTRLAGEAPPVVIDVRTPMEFSTGHIPGALNIPHDVLASRIGEVEAPNGVAIYCMRGPRARMGEASLFAAGYSRSVVHVEGGFAAWRAEGLPVER